MLKPSLSLMNAEDLKLLNVLEKVSEAIYSAYGFKVPVSSPAALVRLAQTPSEKKRQVTESYEQWLTWPEVHFKPFSERILLERALKQLRLRISDSFWAEFSEKDFVEIYSADMIQLYRSYNFFAISGYSLLDLSVFEWYKLWERSPVIMKQMESYAISALKGESDVTTVNIPRHFLRETHHTGMTEPFVPRACLSEFRAIAPLKHYLGDEIRGFVVTSAGEIIAEGRASMDISII
jgi:hypothetical protein